MAKKAAFNYIIVGHGLAGLQLALAMTKDPFFKAKNIALIDPELKNKNDKTWSFWEQEPSNWLKIPHKKWDKAKVLTTKKQVNLDLHPYNYKSIRSIDFYNYAKKHLQKHDNIYFIKDAVTLITESNKIEVKTEKNTIYTAQHVFDSRLPKKYYQPNKSIQIVQHFKGLVIKTKENKFNPNKITMMDYRLKDGNTTSFTYVLPFSKNEALIEFTYFTKNTVNEATYNKFLKIYIKDFLKIEDYDILESETGQIPMSTFPFHNYNTKGVTKIGTGGGWVKASTGYAFKNTEKKVLTIINNIKTNKTPALNLYSKKHRFYDKIFLKVLHDNNENGEWIFEQFYAKNSVNTMFKFLDEDSNFYEEFKIMSALFSWQFIKAFFKTLF